MVLMMDGFNIVLNQSYCDSYSFHLYYVFQHEPSIFTVYSSHILDPIPMVFNAV